MIKPLFSIVIPTYNSYTKLLRAIDSIKAQSFQDFEIVIVDDGSKDETPKKIKLLLSDKIHYFYKNNGGPASARNLGIKKSNGKYICFLDADDEFFENKLLEFSRYTKKDIPFIFSDAEYYNENSKISFIFSSEKYMKHEVFFDSLLENNFIVASTVCIKKSILDNSKLFDEDERLKFVEDYDLWLQLLNKISFQYIKIPLTKYYIHDSNNSSNIQRTFSSLSKVYSKWILSSKIAMKNFVKYNILRFMYFLRIKK